MSDAKIPNCTMMERKTKLQQERCVQKRSGKQLFASRGDRKDEVEKKNHK